ncbi:MAG: diguanylate cyclase [Alphaproteobacteria bacterium]|nr:diguanylate cyclase [Alphaproteobacteria bacterium]
MATKQPLHLRPSQALTIENLKSTVNPADPNWRTQGTTLAMLKHAYDQIETAERMIAQQEKRIRQLEDLASTDPMTGLMNRRGFETFFAHEQARIRRHNSPGALLALIDLDRFKQINDTHGHQAGDACLKLVAKHLLSSIRIVDGAARFGGDEFALLLTQTDPEKAMVRIYQVKDTLNSMRLDWQGTGLEFGASIGVEPVRAETEWLTAYEAADKALYADKTARRAGR